MTFLRPARAAESVPSIRPRRLWAAAAAVAATAVLSACGPTSPAAGSGAAPAAGDVAAASPTDVSAPVDPAPSSASASASATHKVVPSVTPSKAKPASAARTHSKNSGSGSGGATVAVPVNAPQAVQAAFRQARADGKNVLLDFGSTSCFACRTVHALYSDPSVKAEIAAHYHLVEIDINTNMALLQKYDSSGSYAMPVLFVVTPSGTIRVDTNKTGHPRLDKSAFLNWLTQWAG